MSVELQRESVAAQTARRGRLWLPSLLLANIAATILHYVDNIFIVLEAALAVVLIGSVASLQVRGWLHERHAEVA